MRLTVLLMSAAVLFTVAPRVGARDDAETPKEPDPEEQKVVAAGLSADGPALVEFFRQRARLDADTTLMESLTRDLGDDDPKVRTYAATSLVQRGPAALPLLRRAINDIGDPERAARARQCVQWIEGSDASALVSAAAQLLARKNPPGAAAALLAYLPAAEDDQVIDELTAALTTLAYPADKPNAALLKALEDASPLRRAVAATALCHKGRPEQQAAVRKLLSDPKPLVRLRAALALAGVDDVEAVPVLIDLLGELPPGPRQQAEEALNGLAGDWAPNPSLKGEDDVARRIRRDAWAAWWKQTDGPALLAEFRRRTLVPSDRDRVAALIKKLGDDDFDERQRAVAELVAFGPLAAPQLREAARDADAERAGRARDCLHQLAAKDDKKLPAAAPRLLALRKPEGAAETLLEYLPFAEDENLRSEVEGALAGLAVRDGRAEPAVVKALQADNATLRAAAGEALLKAEAPGAREAVRPLLRDGDAAVRVRAALALAAARDKGAVPVLIDALADEPSPWTEEAQEVLLRLAGDKAPKLEAAADAAARKKQRDAWADWWKDAAASADLAVLAENDGRRMLGYTLLVEANQGRGGIGRVTELGPDRKPRWQIDNLQFPVDAYVLGGRRVLVAEYNGRRVTERDLKGNIVWQKDGLQGQIVNAQRLANGNTFIALMNQLMEVDREGKTVYSRPAPGGLIAAYKGRDGVTTCLTNTGQCQRLGPDGKELKSFPSGRGPAWTSGIDVLPNGHVLIAQPDQEMVTEMDTDGNTVWTAKAPGITTATHLPDGHTLVASYTNNSVQELDHSGKVVWEYKNEMGVFRARRR